MGGDALPFPTQRLTPDRYNDVSHRLLHLLSTYYTLVCIPHPCPNKQSYGDVDILVAQPYPLRPFDPVAQLGSRGAVRNGPTLSFEFEGHQADVICVAESEYDMARLFYSWGDAGMILGMMLSWAGLKFGYKGLFLVRPGECGQLQLSCDRTRVLAWLGLDEAEWLAGFKDEQSVFDWLCKCRWFQHSMFSSRSTQPLKQNARRALSTRPMFVHFMQYVDNHTSATTNLTDRPTAQALQADALAFFGCEAAVAALDAAAVKRQALKQRWNGQLVAARTGLEGKQLGLFMMACRQLVTDDELLAMEADEIDRFMDSNYAKYVGSRNHGLKSGDEESKQSELSAEAA